MSNVPDQETKALHVSSEHQEGRGAASKQRSPWGVMGWGGEETQENDPTELSLQHWAQL